MRALPPIVFILLALPASAQEEVVELDDEDFEVLEEGDVEIEEEEEESFSTRQVFGRLHPATTHFGVAWAVLALPFALARMRWKGLGRTDLALVAAAVAGATAAVVTGLVHAPDVMGRPGIEELVELHEHLALATLAVLAAALVVRVVIDKRPARALWAGYAILLAAALGLVLTVGHLGGRITFGEGFLPF